MSWKKSLGDAFSKVNKKAPTGTGTAATIAAAWMMGLPFVVEGALVIGGIARDVVKKNSNSNDEEEATPNKRQTTDWNVDPIQKKK